MLTSRVEQELELLRRHLLVLRWVREKGPIGIMKLSVETGLPEHQVRYSLRVLEQNNLIEPSLQGAVSTRDTREILEKVREDIDELRDRITEVKELL